jgi:hypothetical protein
MNRKPGWSQSRSGQTEKRKNLATIRIRTPDLPACGLVGTPCQASVGYERACRSYEGQRQTFPYTSSNGPISLPGASFQQIYFCVFPRFVSRQPKAVSPCANTVAMTRRDISHLARDVPAVTEWATTNRMTNSLGSDDNVRTQQWSSTGTGNLGVGARR